jgi:hypothetical protein
MPPKRTFYEILNCEPVSNASQIRAEFLALIRRVHPDKQHPRISQEKCAELAEKRRDSREKTPENAAESEENAEKCAGIEEKSMVKAGKSGENDGNSAPADQVQKVRVVFFFFFFFFFFDSSIFLFLYFNSHHRLCCRYTKKKNHTTL